MKRVKKGERYWFVINDGCGYFTWDYAYEENTPYDYDRYANNNYFRTKEEAEAMAEKIRKVLKGASVIEMPSEEDVYNEEFKTNPYFFGKDGAAVVGAHQAGFKHCYEWLKSKIVK